MIRFKLRTLLLTMALLAGWIVIHGFSRFWADCLYDTLSLFMYTIPILAAIHAGGSRRAFWIGVAVILLVPLVPLQWNADVQPIPEVAERLTGILIPKPPSPVYGLTLHSITLIATALLAGIGGTISVWIYRWHRAS